MKMSVKLQAIQVVIAIAAVIGFVFVSCTSTAKPAACSHVYGEWVVETAASCTAAGKGTRVCTLCGEEDANTVIPVTPHTFAATARAPTCDLPGEGDLLCTKCNRLEKGNIVPPLGHDLQWRQTRAPTIITTGVESYICQRRNCSYVEETRTVMSSPTTSLNQFNTSLTTIRSGGDNREYTINIDGDINGLTPIPFTFTPGRNTGFGAGKNITVTLVGKGSLNTLDSNGFMFYLLDGHTLIIDSENLTLNGRRSGANGHTGDNDEAVIYVDKGSTLELRRGKITGNSNTRVNGSGGGVNVWDGGTFVMTGGEIRDNIAYSGAGVCVMENSSFSMEGGIINGNTATADSGGVLVYQSSFTLKNGVISGNSAPTGGGVYIDILNKSADFTMEGGIISDNKASGGSGGGGVFIRNNSGSGLTFTKTGGIIDDKNIDARFGGKRHAVGYRVLESTDAYFRNAKLGEKDNINSTDGFPQRSGEELNNWTKE